MFSSALLTVQTLSPLRARKLHMTGRVLEPNQPDTPMYQLLQTLGLDPDVYLPGKIVRVEQYQRLDEIRPVGKQLLFGLLSDTSTSGMLAFFINEGITRHKLLGWYYGYPACCTAEYEEHAQDRHNDVPYEQRGFTRKRQYLAPKRNTPPGSFYPCWECIEHGGYEAYIQHHRQCATPYPDQPDDGIVMPDALLKVMAMTTPEMVQVDEEHVTADMA